MKTVLFFLVASTVSETFAQFFVLYGRDTVVQRADPILYPGKVGLHVHEFAGAGNLVPGSNYNTLQSAGCSSLGRANGNPIIEDKSAYWHPALYVKAHNGTYLRVPTNGRQVYYKNLGTGTMRQPFEFPKGFRMVAGDTTRRTAQSHTPTDYDDITQWICHETPTWNQGDAGGFPKNVSSCPQYPFFNGAIHFPHCWNGNGFNINYPHAHMRYPLGDIQSGSCPSTHPIRLPHVFMENNFDLSSLQGQFQLNSFVLSNGDPTGFGWHADFLNGWSTGALPKLLTGSTACYSHDIGDCAAGATFNTTLNVANCAAPLTFKENVDGPLDALPGCNPISKVTSNVQRIPCALGVAGGTGAIASSASSTSETTTSTIKKQTTSQVVKPSTSLTIKSVPVLALKSSTSTIVKSSTKQIIRSSIPTTKKSTTTPNTRPGTSRAATSAKGVTNAATTFVSVVSGSDTADRTITTTVILTDWVTKTVTVTLPETSTIAHHKRSSSFWQLLAHNHGHAHRHDF